MALKYPLGAGTAPVVAPTTGSATTEKISLQEKLDSRPRQPTSNDGIGAKLNELIVEFLSQSLDVLFLALIMSLEPFRVCRGDMVEVIVIEDSFIWCPTG